jgi:hypothetical protein
MDSLVVLLLELFDIEPVLGTIGGKDVQVVVDEALSRSLAALWQDLRIQDLEATG